MYRSTGGCPQSLAPTPCAPLGVSVVSPPALRFVVAPGRAATRSATRVCLPGGGTSTLRSGRGVARTPPALPPRPGLRPAVDVAQVMRPSDARDGGDWRSAATGTWHRRGVLQRTFTRWIRRSPSAYAIVGSEALPGRVTHDDRVGHIGERSLRLDPPPTAGREPPSSPSSHCFCDGGSTAVLLPGTNSTLPRPPRATSANLDRGRTKPSRPPGSLDIKGHPIERS